MDTFFTDILPLLGHDLLFDDDYSKISAALHQLHEWCASYTGIHASHIEDKDVYLSSGKAISPTKAAHCLLEPERTRKFLKGIYDAILDLKQLFPNERIHILYAGTGPYSTLILPLLPFFKPEDIGVYMMDINPISLKALHHLYHQNKLGAYVIEWLETDASKFNLGERNIHLVISETMQNALKREPQVAIMRNLIPQLPAGRIFIPQQITVDVCVLNPGHEVRRLTLKDFRPERQNLGRIFTINQQNLQQKPVRIFIPSYQESEGLFYLTHITTYKQHQLEIYQCSLTLPQRFAQKEKLANKELLFDYVMNENPHFHYQEI